jgi:hypothetical protein
MILPWSKEKDVLAEICGGSWTPRCQQDPGQGQTKYYWLQTRSTVEKWYWNRDTCAANGCPRTRHLDLMHLYNVRALFDKIAIDIAGSFCWSNQGRQYLVVTRDYFTRWQRSYEVPSQKALVMVEGLVTPWHSIPVCPADIAASPSVAQHCFSGGPY